MNQRKFFMGLGAGGLAVALGAGYLIYSTQEKIEEKRADVARLESESSTARKTIEGTPTLEREIIVLREISEVIAQILPSDEDVSQIIRDFYGYAGQSNVALTKWDPKSNARGRTRTAFETVGYQMSLEGDTFALLEMLHRIETHRRLIAVPGFTLTAASRGDIEDQGIARHSVQLTVETYTYERAGGSQLVQIEGYQRKRELLAGEISRRRQALTLANYEYRGSRGRRDPWVDPRVPSIDPDNHLSVPEQMSLVDALRDEVQVAQGELDKLAEAENMLAALVVRRELEKVVVRLRDRLRQIEAESLITYAPAKKRLENDVYKPLEALSGLLVNAQPNGPSKEVLIEIHELMREHIQRGDYVAALDTYETIEGKKDLVQIDPVRKAIVEHIEQAAWEAETLQDFNSLNLQYGGVAIIEEMPPFVVINGASLGIGDRVTSQSEDLEILDIRPNEVDFFFRGVVLTRIFSL